MSAALASAAFPELLQYGSLHTLHFAIQVWGAWRYWSKPDGFVHQSELNFLGEELSAPVSLNPLDFAPAQPKPPTAAEAPQDMTPASAGYCNRADGTPVAFSTAAFARRDTASSETAQRRQNGIAIDGAFAVFHTCATEHSPSPAMSTITAPHSAHLPRPAAISSET
jgi:hypothetical protein